MCEQWPEFEILRNLGKGGSASVDEVLIRGGVQNMKLALKTVIWEGAENADLLKSRCLKEMAILKKVKHPCLPKLYAFKSAPAKAQILMTQGECGDLQQIQNLNGGLGSDEKQIKLCAAEILLALEDLHKNGIVYADMKPENVLMRSSGHVMLCDFDMSLFVSDLERLWNCDEDQKREKKCVGTLEFCAPEVIQQGMLGYSYASDFWGLGVLLYEITSGRNPFAGLSAEQTVNKILNWSPRLAEEGCNCSGELISFVNSLLRHNPDRRLGAAGVDEIKSHPWFDDFDWGRHLRELMKCDKSD